MGYPRRQSPHLSHSAGFTLVELSIVLIIIGLIAGAVLVGQELIRAGEVRAQVKQLQQFEIASNTFRLKYNGLPGDISNASNYWSTAVNGNGNGLLENAWSMPYDMALVPWTSSTELQSFFIHLSLAQLVAGNYDGSMSVGKGVPPLALNKAATFFAGDSSNFDGTHGPYLMPYRRGNNLFWMVVCNGLSSNQSATYDDNCGIFTTADAFAVDSKIDDGAPLAGKFLSFGGYSTVTSTTPCLNGTEYDFSLKGRQCQAAYVFN